MPVPKLIAKARRADDLEAAAYADLYAAAPAGFARATGMRVETVAGATLLIAPPLPAHSFNRAIGLGMRRPVTEKDLDAVIERFRAAGCKEYWIHLNPFARPAALGQWLAARGLAPPKRRSWAKVVHGGGPPPEIATPFAVRPASAADMAAFSDIVGTAFGMPPAIRAWLAGLVGRRAWKTYLAWSGATAVSAAALFIDGDGAWLGLGSTLPEFRQQGGQGALMTRRILDAREAGCTIIVTETGEPMGDEPNHSLANMYRCGFERVCSRLNYAGPGKDNSGQPTAHSA